MNDETLSAIRQLNQELSDLVGLPYTDFYRPERFMLLFELNVPECGTLLDYCVNFDNFYFNRVFIIGEVIYTIKENKHKIITKRIINAIKREFKGLGG